MKIKITALYARSAQANDQYIKEQKKKLEEYAAEHGYIICSHFTDDGYSVFNNDRPAFRNMLTTIENSEVDTVIVCDPHRISGSYEYLFDTVYPLLDRYSVKLLAVDGSLDGHYDVSEDRKSLLKRVAEMERKEKERTA